MRKKQHQPKNKDKIPPTDNQASNELPDGEPDAGNLIEKFIKFKKLQNEVLERMLKELQLEEQKNIINKEKYKSKSRKK